MIKATNISTLKGHGGSVYGLSKGPQEHQVFSASSDKFIALWNLETMQAENFAAKLPALCYAICYVPEKNILLAGTSAGSVHIIDVTSKQEIKVLQHHTAPVFEINYSMVTSCFYTSCGNGEFAVCSLETLSALKIKKLCNEKTRSVDFNYITSEMAIASGDGAIRVFDLFSLEEKWIFEAHQLSSNCVKYMPNANILVSGGRDAHLNFWEVREAYSLVKTIPAHNFAIYDIVFSPQGNLFATASRDKTIKIWDSNTFDFLLRITIENETGHTFSVNKLLWLGYNNYLISAGDDRMVRVWNVESEI